MSDICISILGLLDDYLIPTSGSGESKVFYLKMKGDYHRYLAEFKTSADKKDAADKTLSAYKEAQVCKRNFGSPVLVYKFTACAATMRLAISRQCPSLKLLILRSIVPIQ